MKKPIKTTEKNFFLKPLVGADLSSRQLAYLEIKSPKAGPVVWLTAGIHGDEVGGVATVQEVFKKLRQVGLLKGRVCAFPLLYPFGFEMGVRQLTLTNEDLNRVFPGKPDGTLGERLMHLVFNQIKATKPALVLDMHNDWRNSLPYAIIDDSLAIRKKPAYKKAQAFVLATGLVAISESAGRRISQEAITKTLSGCLLFNNIPALTLEIGGAGSVNEEDVIIGVNVISNLLADLKMIAPAKQKFSFDLPTGLSGKILLYSQAPLCSKSGLIRFLVKPGEVVKKGQPVAKVYDVFGKLLETLSAESQALVLGCSDSSSALPGLPVVALGKIK